MSRSQSREQEKVESTPSAVTPGRDIKTRREVTLYAGVTRASVNSEGFVSCQVCSDSAESARGLMTPPPARFEWQIFQESRNLARSSCCSRGEGALINMRLFVLIHYL